MRPLQFTTLTPVPFQGQAESAFSISRWLFLLALTLYFGNGTACADTNTWTRQSVGLGPGSIKALAINPAMPTTLYAGYADMDFGIPGSVFKSTDGGATWVTANTGLTNTSVLALAINPATPTTVYAGTQGGVFKSTDGGATWVAANTGLPVFPARVLAIDPATPVTLYAGTYRGVFKSTDGGTTWAAANTGLPNTDDVLALAVNLVTPAILYAGTNQNGVFKSTDGGATWATANTGLTNTFVTTLAINPATPSTLYAGTYLGGVFKSTDGGATWVAANTGLTNTDVRTLAINPATPTILYAGTYEGGVFKSTDGGATWATANTGLTAAQTGYSRKDYFITTLAISPAAPATLYTVTNEGVFRYDEASNPAQTISDADRIFNYLEATYPQYLSPARAASAITPVYYYRHYPDTNAYIATSGGMVYYLGPASGNSTLLLGTQADFLAAAIKSGF